MSTMKQLLTVGLAIILLVVLWLSVPVQQLQAHGIVLPTGVKSSRVVVPSQVLLIKTMPLDAKKIGAIRVERHYIPGNEEAEVKQAIDKVKMLAASVGANQVVITTFNHYMPGMVPDAQLIWIVQGIAIASDQQPLLLQPGIVMPSLTQ